MKVYPVSCMLTGDSAIEVAHIIDKGKNVENFKHAYFLLYGRKPTHGEEDIQNTIPLRPDIHRNYMDNICKGIPMPLRVRRIVFDFINNQCILENMDTHELTYHNWLTPDIDVRKEYFAWSNERATKRLQKKLRKLDKNLVNPFHWI